MKKFWEVKNQNNQGYLYIYGEVVSSKQYEDEVSASSFKADLDALGDIDRLDIYINSPGGNVFQGYAIYNILSRHKAEKHFYVDGIAASIMSYIPMIPNGVVHMPSNAMMMIHWPWMLTYGNAKELRSDAESLDKIGEAMKTAYIEKTGLSEEKIIALLDAETWLTAQECIGYGFADVLEEESKAAACVDSELFERYLNVPKGLTEKGGNNEARVTIIEQVKNDNNNLKQILGGL